METPVIYGVYFVKGAFFMQLTEVNDTIVGKLLVSKNHCQLPEFIAGAYPDLPSLLKSEKGELAKTYIKTLEFDYMVIGNGETATYYLNTTEGLINCELTFFTKNP
jgi:hypothetical protein